jgi:alpha-ketoglutarate-dependent taurine dioxygenase
VVIRHAETGLPPLCVHREREHHIVSIPNDESESLLLALFDHTATPANGHGQVWSPDVLIDCDKVDVLHARREFDHKEAQIFRRFTEKNGSPTAA